MGASLRNALSGATVKALLRATMPPANVRLTRLIGPLVDSAVRQFANTTGVARRVVGTEFNPASMGALIRRLYFSALSAAATRSADIGGVNMHINVGGNAGIDATGNAVIPPTGLWSGIGTAPANVGAAVDNVAGASRTGRIPPVRASGSVLRQLSSLPAGWAGFRAAAPTALSGSTLTADLTTALTAAWFNRLTAAPPAGPAIARRAALGRAVNASVNAAATAAATNGIRAFLQGELEPVMRTSTTALMSSIGDEVTRIMGTPANQLALTAPRDPDIAALATAMQARMTAQATAATTAQTAAGGTAINPGTTAPDQEVTYSSVNMMSDNTDIFRQDQFTHLATLFNAQSALRQSGEGDVHAELGAR